MEEKGKGDGEMGNKEKREAIRYKGAGGDGEKGGKKAMTIVLEVVTKQGCDKQ